MGRTMAAGLAAAAMVTLAAPGDARAGGTEEALFLGTGLSLIAADIAFAANGLTAAVNGRLDRDDGWLVAQTVLTSPQTIALNGLLLAMNTEYSRSTGDLATALGIVPTLSVSALTTHAIWGLADPRAHADTLAGVSVLVGANIALTSPAIGRLVTWRLHTRGVGVLAMVASAPGTAIAAYESARGTDDRGAWIGLTAWSGALFVHGLASVIANQTGESDLQASRSGSTQPAARRSGLAAWTPPFTLAPTVVTDGVARVPGVMVTGVF